jgi:hypothetical protein
MVGDVAEKECPLRVRAWHDSDHAVPPQHYHLYSTGADSLDFVDHV